jgi:hypothetical protein
MAELKNANTNYPVWRYKKLMSENEGKLLFNICVIEGYRDKHKLDGEKVISLFKANSIFDYLAKHYDTLHTMSIESVINDIEEILCRRQQ